ncbi:ABC transporter substrate-binding protein [Rhizobium sp. R72]|uniref:ABC transporter substrate-binding protein n=1 Tax=unclassified Rhizobium TaxID=2613769 RepID=UPI000B5365FF|nr:MULTISPECIES: ABC transporter substrate-binding protein [unclassified Rhizobium]OWV98656.1 ABC transporter substrate-binding protein [Rhizobium sp. R72]OWV98690.1 ABC transporter substrate-binding protein [Rhizobium sp. R711]
MAIGLTRRHVLVAGVSHAAVSIAGTFAWAPLATAEEQIGSITWALPSIPNTLFIPGAWTTYTGAIMSLVQEGPLTFGDDLTLEPASADKWEQVDPITIKYHLRSGVKFGDGSPLTGDDVVATFNYHMSPDSGSPLASFYNSVESVEATAADEVTVKLKAPNVQFAFTAAHMAGFVFKKEQLADKNIGSPEVLPLGTGPYKIVEFVPSDHVIIEARDDYWGPKPVVNRITLRAIPDRQARLLAMRQGEIDGTFDLAISDVDQWKALSDVAINAKPSLGVFALILDHSAPPFDDIHVRRAVAHAVDREGLVKALLKGYGEPATELNPPEMWSGVLPPDEVRAFYATLLPHYRFDLDKAKAELAQSSHADGFDVTIPASTDDPYMVNIMQSVAENLKQIGIRAHIHPVDNNTWFTNYVNHDELGMQIMAYYPDYADAANYPDLFFSKRNAEKGRMNGSNFKNDEVEAELKTANENANPTARANALKRVFEIAHEDVAVVPIFWPHSAMAINNKYKLTGYTAFWYSIPWATRGFGLK